MIIPDLESVKALIAREAAAGTTAAIGFSNTSIVQLLSKAQSAGPQFVDGSRWLSQITGTTPINGGTVVAGSGHIWVREVHNQTIDAAWFGATDAANASTIMNAIAACRDGGTVNVPKGLYTHTGGRLYINGRNNLTINMEGVIVQATADLSNAPENGGFYIINSKWITINGGTYDGRLDSRTPLGSDPSDLNLINGWAVLSGCVGVILNGVTGHRCMMDGIYVGHGDATTVGIVTNVPANWPRDTQINHCIATYNYRQGISLVCVDGLIIRGGDFSYTGKLKNAQNADIFPPAGPCAGIDAEAFVQNGWLNTRVYVTGNPAIHHNRGIGLLIENGTQGMIVDSGRIYDNDSTGVGISNFGTQDNSVTGVDCENNCLSTAEKIEVIIRGSRNHFRNNTVKCGPGIRGISASLPGAFQNIIGNTVISLAPAVGVSSGGIFVAGENCRIEGNTTIDAVFTGGGYGAIHSEGFGNTVTGNRALTYLVGNPTTHGVRAMAGTAYASGNSAIGYAIAVDTNAPGSPLPLPDPVPKIMWDAGRPLSNDTNVNTQTAIVLSNDADLLVYRVEHNGLIFNSGTADVAYFRVDVPAGYSYRIRRASAQNPNVAPPLFGQVSARPGVMNHVTLAIPANTYYVMGLSVDVELRRA